MHYALNPRTFLYSHYFYTGVRIAIGVIGLTCAVLYASDLATAMTVCIGALCASYMDLPSPLRHKFHEMMASVLLCTAVTLIITLCGSIHLVLGVMLVLISFFSSMTLIYGRKAMPLQFAALLVMVLSMENQLSTRQALMHSALFFGGAATYMAYAMAASWFFRSRIKQQVLAEAMFELAYYIQIKSEFYDMHTDLSSQYKRVVRQQSVLAEKQQASRDMILRGNPNRLEAIAIQVHFGMLDLYEQILSTYTDYAHVRHYLADADVLSSLQSMAHKAALDTESIAFAITRKRASYQCINYDEERQAILAEIARLQARQTADGGTAHGKEALTVLRGVYAKMSDVIETIGKLHLATQAVVEPLPMLPGADMTAFLTRQKYEFGVLRDNLHWNAPIFRYSLRVAMAIALGLLVAEHLPYSSHGYWIVLTIAIVLKPTFSMTKQRRGDRLIGTVVGCLLTAVIVHFVHAPAAILAFLFIATVAVPSFLYIKYRYAAVAASMQILLQMSLMTPAVNHLIGERVIDTFIGVAIASLFSFVLPSWEYRDLPMLMANVLESNRRYLEAGCNLLTGGVSNDLVYRICRKRFLDSVAVLSSALARMLDEPPSKQRAVGELNMFIVENYLTVAHISALRLLLRRRMEGLPKPQVDAQLQQTFTQVETTLSEAGQQTLVPVPSSAAQQIRVEAEAAAWSGWPLLLRRLSLLQADAGRIAMRSVLIERALNQAA